ncbi:MAG: thymidine phosphorylase family protein [Planctomycetota bacterium]|nr:thymidine phosphorylase family protein [Planctomycetota bacterium]
MTTRLQTLKIRRVAIDTFHENVVYLHRECPLYRSEGFQALAKVSVQVPDAASEPLQAVLNVVGDGAIIAVDEIGLSEQAFEQLGVSEGTPVVIEHAARAASLAAVYRKIAGERLSADELDAIAQDIAANRYSKIELTAFLVSCTQGGLDRDEVLDLTRAMVRTGRRLDWGEGVVVDKHCIGGIPGNRTSMIVVPIVAAHGMLFPKTSSRAITSPAGTADTMEVLARVDLDPAGLHRLVRRHRGCIVWGGTSRLAPVDEVLISVERPLSMDSPGQMVASILSKKVAAGSTHLLIDIPVGPSAKVRDTVKALALRKLFEYVGDRLGLHVQVVLTDGTQPIGRGIGPLLEARDVMRVLENDPAAPRDLREKSLQLAGRILEYDPDMRGGAGFDIARDILDSGRALEKMNAIIDAQGREEDPPELGRLQQAVAAPHAGVITAIDNLKLARIARLAGAPLDKGAGVDLHVKCGDEVAQGDALYTVYAAFHADFRFALDAVEEGTGYTIGRAGARR